MSRRDSNEHRRPKFQGTHPFAPDVTVDFLQTSQRDEVEMSRKLPSYTSQQQQNVPSSNEPENVHLEPDPPSSIIFNSTLNKALPHHRSHRGSHSVPSPDHYASERSWDHNVRKDKRLSANVYSTTPGAKNFEDTFACQGTSNPSIADEISARRECEATRNITGHKSNMDHSPNDQFNHSPYYRSDMYNEQPQASQAQFINSRDILPHSRSSVSPSPHSQNREQYNEVPYRYSRNVDSGFCDFDPRSIEDDGDDGLEYKQRQRLPVLNFGQNERNSLQASTAAGTSRTSMFGAIGKKSNNSPMDSPIINSMGTNNGRYGSDETPKTDEPTENEKSEWLSKQSSARSRLRILVLLIVTLLVVGGITGGVLSGIMHKKSSSGSTGSSPTSDTGKNGDLNKNSAEIKKLLNNPKLHKVFPTIDYTPARSQYPDCLSEPPSQNDITRDLAVLSQLSNTIRLYGTDCNQTEMLIHSIKQLDLNDQAKIWMGVWLNKNETTNHRQVSQMYQILDEYGTSPFVGVIVGNEVLFREDMTVTELGNMLTGIKSNLTSKGISLPIASSDLGDDWTSQLASKTDILMANIHPFFAGVAADVAASWTWNFWQQHNVILQPDESKNIISETGWPSAGGTSCGGASTCSTGSVASVESLNTFMNDWVCQALANGTNYFWFEAFDEPWKIGLNEPGKEWEDKWGLLDSNRKLKPGVVIPSCGGKTVD